MNDYPIDHVAVAVPSVREAAPMFQLLSGSPCSQVEELPSQGVNVAFVGELELLEPRGPDSAVARFLDRRGPGLHHVAYRVPDIDAALERLRNQGVRLVDDTPRAGARGHRVAFVHPESASGVLVELVEHEG